MPTHFTAGTTFTLNSQVRREEGARRVEKIEQLILTCVENNSAITGCFVYKTSDAPQWHGFGMVLSECPLTSKRYGQQIYHFLVPASNDIDSLTSSASTVDSLPDEPKHTIADVLKILATDIITTVIHSKKRDLSKTLLVMISLSLHEQNFLCWLT